MIKLVMQIVKFIIALIVALIVVAVLIFFVTAVGRGLFMAYRISTMDQSEVDAMKVDVTTTQMTAINALIQIYKLRFSSQPKTLKEIHSKLGDELTIPTVREMYRDAWEREILYTIENDTYELRSRGVDGQLDTADDIVVTETELP